MIDMSQALKIVAGLVIGIEADSETSAWWSLSAALTALRSSSRTCPACSSTGQVFHRVTWPWTLWQASGDSAPPHLWPGQAVASGDPEGQTVKIMELLGAVFGALRARKPSSRLTPAAVMVGARADERSQVQLGVAQMAEAAEPFKRREQASGFSENHRAGRLPLRFRDRCRGSSGHISSGWGCRFGGGGVSLSAADQKVFECLQGEEGRDDRDQDRRGLQGADLGQEGCHQHHGERRGRERAGNRREQAGERQP
jgi:hypothetical protein